MDKQTLEAIIADDEHGLLDDHCTREELEMAAEFVRFFKSQGLI